MQSSIQYKKPIQTPKIDMSSSPQTDYAVLKNSTVFIIVQNIKYSCLSPVKEHAQLILMFLLLKILEVLEV